jgi:hypothetical protein
MTEQEKRYMEIAINASEISIAACQVAQAVGYLKKRHAKSRLLDAIVALDLTINTDIFTKEDITYMVAKYKKKTEEEKVL